MEIAVILFISFLIALEIASAQTVPGNPPARFLRKKYETIRGRRMAYVEVGEGDPIVFLHGNPTSSYLWRNVMPHVEGKGRLIAPDLIGMGDSDKLPATDPSRYSFLQHANFIFALLERLQVKEHITFVIHDWGSALGFWWAYLNRHNPNAVRGIVFMEAVVKPFNNSNEFAFAGGDAEFIDIFNRLRGPSGEQMVLRDNIFVEELLPAVILRDLTTAELDEYRRPYRNAGEDRRVTLTWSRQVPIDGTPVQVVNLVQSYSNWLAASVNLPKLFVKAQPGLILRGALADFVRSWPNLKEVSVPGVHFPMEDVPELIGQAISTWLPVR